MVGWGVGLELEKGVEWAAVEERKGGCSWSPKAHGGGSGLATEPTGEVVGDQQLNC